MQERLREVQNVVALKTHHLLWELPVQIAASDTTQCNGCVGASTIVDRIIISDDDTGVVYFRHADADVCGVVEQWSHERPATARGRMLSSTPQRKR